MGGTPSPPLRIFFQRKGGYGFGGTPPPFTDKIRKVVFDRLPNILIFKKMTILKHFKVPPTPCTMVHLLGYFKPINQWEENSHPLSPDLSLLDFFLWVKGNQFLLSGEYLKLKIEVQEHTLKPYLLEPSILHN